jgi:hypothetical protein
MIKLNQNAPPAPASRVGLLPGRDGPSAATVARKNSARARSSRLCPKIHPLRVVPCPLGPLHHNLLPSPVAPLVALNVSWEGSFTGGVPSPLEVLALKQVVHLLFLSRVYNRKVFVGGFRPLGRERILRDCGSLGARALDWLVNGFGFVASDGWSVKGRKARGYRFTLKACRLGFSVEPMPSGCLKQFRTATKARVTAGRDHGHKQQLSTLRTVTLAPAARTEIAALKGRRFNLRQVAWAMAVLNIESGNWFFSVDSKTGRVFHNVNSFPKALRPHLLLDGEATAEVDISNSQPTLLVAEAYRGAMDTDEAQDALGIVQTRQFYPEVCRLYGKGGLNYEAQKTWVFKHMLFSHKIRPSPGWSKVKERWPRLAGYIEKTKAKAHNSLPLELQRREADVMLGRVAPRLQQEGIPSLSLHDGLLVKRQHVDRAREIVIEEFQKETGITPDVRTEPNRETTANAPPTNEPPTAPVWSRSTVGGGNSERI